MNSVSPLRSYVTPAQAVCTSCGEAFTAFGPHNGRCPMLACQPPTARPSELAHLLAHSGTDWRPSPCLDMEPTCQRCPEPFPAPSVVQVTYRLGDRVYVESVCSSDASRSVRDARRCKAEDVTVLVPTADEMGRAA